MSEITQELMDELVDAVGEDGAFQLIEFAENTTEDPVTYLKAELKKKTKPVKNGSSVYGWSVVPCAYTRTYEDDDGREVVENVDRGFVLKFSKPPCIDFYYGKSHAECASLQSVGDPFEDRGQAEAACRLKADLVSKSIVRSLRTCNVRILLSKPQVGVSTPKKIQKQLTQRQQDAISTVTASYSQLPGYGVKNDSDSVALILDRIADALRLPRET